MNLVRAGEKDRERERKMSLSNDLPVISIERKPLEGVDDVDGSEPPLRRSVSLPRMEGPVAIDLDKPLPELKCTLSRVVCWNVNTDIFFLSAHVATYTITWTSPPSRTINNN